MVLWAHILSETVAVITELYPISQQFNSTIKEQKYFYFLLLILFQVCLLWNCVDLVWEPSAVEHVTQRKLNCTCKIANELSSILATSIAVREKPHHTFL